MSSYLEKALKDLEENGSSWDLLELNYFRDTWNYENQEITPEIQNQYNQYFKTLIEILQKSQTLKTIYLNGIKNNREYLDIFIEILKVNKSATTLYFWAGLGDQEIKKFADVLKINKSVTYLNLNRNIFTNQGVAYLTETIRERNILKELFLCESQITKEGIQHIATLLETNTSLKVLSLESINFSREEDSKILAKGLRQNKTLEFLNLKNTGLNLESGKPLWQCLKENITLKILNLENNTIDYHSAIELGKVLKVNSSLEKLYLNSNQIGDDGIKELVEGMRANKGLTEIYLERNNITLKYLPQLIELLESNRRLTDIDFISFGDLLYPEYLTSPEATKFVELQNRNKYQPVKRVEFIALLLCLKLKNIFLPYELKLTIWNLRPNRDPNMKYRFALPYAKV